MEKISTCKKTRAPRSANFNQAEDKVLIAYDTEKYEVLYGKDGGNGVSGVTEERKEKAWEACAKLVTA